VLISRSVGAKGAGGAIVPPTANCSPPLVGADLKVRWSQGGRRGNCAPLRFLPEEKQNPGPKLLIHLSSVEGVHGFGKREH